MLKIASIVGARPQFIKYFPVSKAIEKFNDQYGNLSEDILIHTGQHYDYSMSKVFFDELGIKEPDYHLGVGSGTHGEQTGKIIQKIETVLFNESPDMVLVYGDTNSTLGGALAAAKLKIPVVHIEAGLRSFNKHMPEEINRILTDHASTFLICPTETAIKNLVTEGFSNIINNGKVIPFKNFYMDKQAKDIKIDSNNPSVINTGDVMYDALLYSMKIAEEKSVILDSLDLKDKDYYLLTLHRAENTDNREKLEEIIKFVNSISENRTVLFPMHPRTTKIYKDIKIRFDKNIRIIEPLGYFDILQLLNNSKLVMTDSGGMQKEAYWLKIPCITLRDETEWVETVQSGWNVLYKNYNGNYNISDVNRTCYGDGKAAERIVKFIFTQIQR